MSISTIRLGGTVSNVTIAKAALGLMRMTWRLGKAPAPDEQYFETIKASIDLLPPGVKLFINSGEFYNDKLSVGNLELITRFFKKYPDYADRTFLSVKGGLKPGTLIPDASPENLRRSVDAINTALGGIKRLDLFESARVDKNIPIEEAIDTLVGMSKEGKFGHIGLSEVRAETLRRANTVYPIAAMEVEVSLWSYEEETRNVIAASRELGIPIAAYSYPSKRPRLGPKPITPTSVPPPAPSPPTQPSSGLTGAIKSIDDIPDFQRRMSRFKSDEIIKHNYAFVDALKAIAERKQITVAQLSITWVSTLGPHVVPMPGSSSKERALENMGGGAVVLSEEELAEIDMLMQTYEIIGDRYFGNNEALYLWG